MMFGLLDYWLLNGLHLTNMRYFDDGDDTVTIRFADYQGNEICVGRGKTNQEIAESAKRDYWIVAAGTED